MKRMVIDLPNGKTMTVAISQEIQRRYWFGMCPISSKIGNLKLCSGCRVVGYIGKEEQKEDWKSHKKLCKILTNLRDGKQHWLGNFSDGDAFAEALRSKLERPLTQYELDMSIHPRKCIICDSYDQDKLSNCQKCYCVAFCPEHGDEGKIQHEPHCSLLRTALDDHKFETTVGHQVQNYAPTVTTSDFVPLPADIESFFADDVSSLVSKKLPGYRDSESRYLTFLYTCPLTVLHALEETGLGSTTKIESIKELTIHLVGCRIAEMRSITAWEILACRLPRIDSLNLVFIGDECDNMEFPKTFRYKGKELQNADRKPLVITYSIEPKTLYHTFMESPRASKPDVIVALDCGFKFYPTWRRSIPMMVRENVPLIFTEFTLQDTKDNLDLIRSLVKDVNVLIEPRRNAFCSKRPVRCSDATGNYVPHSVIFTNDYLCVVDKK